MLSTEGGLLVVCKSSSGILDGGVTHLTEGEAAFYVDKEAHTV